MPRRVLGLYVTHRQPHEPEVIPWKVWLTMVEEAARQAVKSGRHMRVDRHEATKLSPPAFEKCQFHSPRTGKRCKDRAMRGGATRCRTHGGPRQVPHHPHTVRLWLTGQIETVANDGRGPKAGPPAQVGAKEADRLVCETLKAKGMYHRGPLSRAGRHAIRFGTFADWQAWLAQVNAIAAQEQNQ